jgi:GDP-L-fucose synthase
MHVDDLAEACLFLMENYSDPVTVNIGVGHDISIKELAELVQRIVGFTGEINWDTSKPNGTPRKLMDVSRLSEMGYKAKISLEDGIRGVYEEFVGKRELSQAGA